MTTGSQGGLYLRLLKGRFRGKCPPHYPNRKRNPKETSRRKAMRALYRRLHHKTKYQLFGVWVKGIRRALHQSKSDFARMMGISEVTRRRWENGLGHLPSPKNMARLEKLETLAKDLKKEGTTI